ncbi:hypothetical protein RMSM_01159 [Rhodopirellula maiorica SM1]|uniref:Uncharacterized protein n=1 Tax=Rhodopirellula maiorica SM1 TaxID=1265738 RepID=M5RRT8_9BACT|nr:hypothetical protein RMSM_01159 [Rhodopirellula maiorica SM1]
MRGELWGEKLAWGWEAIIIVADKPRDDGGNQQPTDSLENGKAQPFRKIRESSGYF